MLTVVWLRVYPIHEVLGYLFGVSDSTVSRTIARVLALLEQAGRDTMRMPDPGRKRRRQLDDLLRDTPELALMIDSFEQKIQRPKDPDERDGFYSGKKRHTPSRAKLQLMRRPVPLWMCLRVYPDRLLTSTCSNNRD